MLRDDELETETASRVTAFGQTERRTRLGWPDR